MTIVAENSVHADDCLCSSFCTYATWLLLPPWILAETFGPWGGMAPPYCLCKTNCISFHYA